MRARALRAPVFLGSLPRQTGRCAPPTRPSQLRCFCFFLSTGPQRLWNRKSPCPPAPPIAASLILPAIFLGSNYVLMRPDTLIFSVFSFFYSFRILSFCYYLLFCLSFSFSFSSYSSLLISSYSSRRCYSSSSYIQGADNKLGQFLSQDIYATANHRNCLQHSLESWPSLVWFYVIDHL